MLFHKATNPLQLAVVILSSSFISRAVADGDTVTVNQKQWGFLNPVAARFVPNPSTWQNFRVGQQITIGFISPFQSTRVILQTPDGTDSKVIADNQMEPEFNYTLSTDGFPAHAYTFVLNISAVSTNDPHFGLALVSSHFNVTQPPTEIFGPLSHWSFGSLLAILFTATLVIVGLLSGCAKLMSSSSKGSAGRSSVLYTPANAAKGNVHEFAEMGLAGPRKP